MSETKNKMKDVVKSQLQWQVSSDLYLVKSRKGIKDLCWANLSSTYNEVILQQMT